MAGRLNKKEVLISNADSIKKSNELSTSKLNQGLTLNQMQLLSYAIYSTQKDGSTTFIKADFEKKFGIEKYQTKQNYQLCRLCIRWYQLNIFKIKFRR